MVNSSKTLPFILEPQQMSLITSRVEEFKNIGKSDTNIWFSELCFCILTANSRADKAILIQQQLGPQGFLTETEKNISAVLRSHAHRFHNNKAKYIVGARKFADIKNHITGMDGPTARLFLVKQIKGIGFKEASHFLRNIGYDDVAIIDRHILKFLKGSNLISEIPKTITPKFYISFENILKQFNLPLSKLDLMIWCHVTGKVLK